MSIESLPPVAYDETLSSSFMMSFVIIVAIVGSILLGVVIVRYRRKRQGIITKYVADGDQISRRRKV